MAKKAQAPKRASELKGIKTPVQAPGRSNLEDRVIELEGDLARVVGLLVKGDLDSAKFQEILSKINYSML